MPSEPLLSTYRLPPELSQTLAARFNALQTIPQLLDKSGGCGAGPAIPQRDGERFYRALGQYCATEMADLFATPAGRELYEKITGVMSGEASGIVMKGIPADRQTKALMICGIRTLFADGEAYGDNWDERIPQQVGRRPIAAPAFHRDGPPNMADPESRSFLFMASAQQADFTVPTLFKRTGALKEDHIKWYFAPDELVLCNNKKLEHSTGVGHGQNREMRELIRYTVTGTHLAHSPENLEHVKRLRGEGSVPADQEALKKWLLKESARLAGLRDLGRA